jgi:hypothetical protein
MSIQVTVNWLATEVSAVQDQFAPAAMELRWSPPRQTTRAEPPAGP